MTAVATILGYAFVFNNNNDYYYDDNAIYLLKYKQNIKVTKLDQNKELLSLSCIML